MLLVLVALPALVFCARATTDGAAPTIPAALGRREASPPDTAEAAVQTTDVLEYVTACAKAHRGTAIEVVPREATARRDWKTAPYTLEAAEGAVRLRLSFHLITPPREERDLRERLETTRSCLAGFFRRHGIELAVDFDADPRDGATVDVRTRVAQPGDLRMRQWAFGVGTTDFPPDHVCTTVAHEIGHWLGLLDEYPEAGTGILGETDSVMRYAHCAPAQVRFRRRHVVAFLEPLCAAGGTP